MKVFVLAGFSRSLLNFRRSLIERLLAQGYDVVCAAPGSDPQVEATLRSLGARYVPLLRLRRTGLNPVWEWLARRELRMVLARERPDALLAYTIKPIVHGLPAARAVGVKASYALVTGLGAAFNLPGLRGMVLSTIGAWLYRVAFRYATCVIAQNQDILEIFRRRRILLPTTPAWVVPGSGVDTEHFRYVVPPSSPNVFLLIGRMLHDKGVCEFVAAARILRRDIPGARFVLLGDIDTNPTAIAKSQLDAWCAEGVVEYHPGVTDVRPWLAACTVFVLPSYHEGLPRSVLEAMATGRPVVTSDTIGCRETVINAGRVDAAGIRIGENGLLVPVKSVEPLARAMLRLARDPEMCVRMGARGRALALERFDVQQVNRQMLRAMGLGGSEQSSAQI